MQYVRRSSSGVLATLMLFCATSAFAAGTPQGTPVTNSVTLNFSVNGNSQSDTADVTFAVDRKLVVDVTTTDADWVTVVPGQSVTGGASGIGRACALRFAEEGATIAVADLNGERAQRVADEITDAGGTAVALEVDTSSASSTTSMVAAALEAFDVIDLCVAAAGISHANYVSRDDDDEESGSDRMDRGDMFVIDKSLESWQRVLDVNLTGVMLTNQAMAKHLVERRAPGALVSIASMAGVTALPGAGEYCVSKAGVWMLTKVLALELARFGIRANAVGPGYIKTPMSAAAANREAWVDARLAETPLRRQGEAVDIANACLYLASDEASFVTGEIIFPDGGLGAAMR